MLWTAGGLILFIYLWNSDRKEAKAIGDEDVLRNQQIGLGISLVTIVLSLILVNFLLPSIWKPFGEGTDRLLFLMGSSVFLSALISGGWYLYLSWLDIYEKESFRYMFLTFGLACLSTFLVFPISSLIDLTGWKLHGGFWNDFLYSSVAIGMVEELAKIIPFLIVLRFTKQINESYDYILYGGVSALGFAFVENTMYLQTSELTALNGRALFASVSHMFDTGVICYCMAIARHRGSSMTMGFLLGYILASLAHGFYDFWLISDYGNHWITIFFFFATIHIFSIMKNNLINISEHFDPKVKMRSSRKKQKLINVLVLVMFAGYILLYFLGGIKHANAFLEDSSGLYVFVVVYLAISFSNMNIVRGYVAPLTLPRSFLIPVGLRFPNYLGLNVRLSFINLPRTSNVQSHVMNLMPVDGQLEERVAINGDVNWYRLQPSSRSENYGALGSALFVKPVGFESHIGLGKKQVFRIAFARQDDHKEKTVFKKKEVRFAGNVFTQLLK